MSLNAEGSLFFQTSLAWSLWLKCITVSMKFSNGTEYNKCVLLIKKKKGERDMDVSRAPDKRKKQLKVLRALDKRDDQQIWIKGVIRYKISLQIDIIFL